MGVWGFKEGTSSPHLAHAGGVAQSLGRGQIPVTLGKGTGLLL